MKLITLVSFFISTSLLFATSSTATVHAPERSTNVITETSRTHEKKSFEDVFSRSTPLLEAYLDALALCESGNNPRALNPNDSDGTPSYGRYQFKPGTFDYFSSLYNVATTSIWNGLEQRALVTLMALDPNVDFHHQFPGCTSKLGLPPQ